MKDLSSMRTECLHPRCASSDYEMGREAIKEHMYKTAWEHFIATTEHAQSTEMLAEVRK